MASQQSRRWRPAPAAAVLLVLLAATAADAAPRRPRCAQRLQSAIGACHDDMALVLHTVQSGQPASAARINAFPSCCLATQAVFSESFMADCGCDASVLAVTSQVPASALTDLLQATQRKCGGVDAATPLAPFPACPGAAAAAAGNGSFSAQAGALPPVGGRGSVCRSTKCAGRLMCRSGYPTDDAYNAALDACNSNPETGFCDLTKPPTANTDLGGGTTVCGGLANVSVVQPVTNPKNSGETCYRCCQPRGDVRTQPTDGSRVRFYRNKNMCNRRVAAGGCFPGAALATLPGGATKPLRELAVGDSVLVAKPDGATAFEPVVFFDHELPGGAHAFVRLTLTTGAALELTAGHFVPVGDSLATAVMTRARDVRPGAAVFVVSEPGAAAEPALVDTVEDVTAEGMFAPVTTGGTIVIDGVVASVYSDWILDPLFDALGWTDKLPAAMHAVHAPLRWGYAALGPRVLRVLSPLISGVAQMDVAQIRAGLRMATAGVSA